MQLADLTFGKLYFTNAGPLEYVPQPYNLFACVFWMFGLYLTVVNVAMTFLFRYNILCRDKRSYLRTFIKIYVICVVLIAVQSGLGFVCFETNEGSHHYTLELKSNGLFAVETPPFSVVDASTIKGAIHLVNTNLITTASYVVVFWTGTRIHRMLRASRMHMSSATIAVQKQLTMILCLQSFYPFVMLAVPIFLAAGLPLFGLKSRGLGLILCCLVTGLPLINAVTVIFVVPSFRRAVLFRSRPSTVMTTIADVSSKVETNRRAFYYPQRSNLNGASDKVL
ncbi:hypothetical protein M3Y98_01216700 [Aphelenchoides besseyi]|nr:hypothetical protein M3Y98_01216700 [Aphelenchoides besseyi]